MRVAKRIFTERVLSQVEAGQRISFLQAYMHRGRLLEDLALYDYMSTVMLKRKRKSVRPREK
jgi:hypothetical protein